MNETEQLRKHILEIRPRWEELCPQIKGISDLKFIQVFLNIAIQDDLFLKYVPTRALFELLDEVDKKEE